MADEIQHIWLWTSGGDLDIEMRQLEEEGRDTSGIRSQFESLKKLGDEKLFLPVNQQKAAEVLIAAQALPMVKGYAFKEPSDLKGIRKLRGRGPRRFSRRLPDSVLKDRIHGAWLGRCIGCFLGKPIEGVRTDALLPFLKATGQYPVSGYMNFAYKGKIAKEHPGMVARAGTEKMRHMPVDDDTNYTTTGLLITENHGKDFTPADVASFWMSNIPALSTCTAERVAYRNFMLHLQPPESAAFRNPYREWIGAQIRADAFGYVNVGNPERAAEFAWRDACISHVKNGIYGEMFIAAMIAAAPFCKDAEELVEVGLSEIPETSRLYRDISEVVGWRRAGLPYEEAGRRIHSRWNEHNAHDWCHTNSNAAICVVGLLWGYGDFGRSICRAVQLCFDTDCNGATVGSIVGMMIGARKIPAKWTTRLNNTLHTSLTGNNVVKISDMAERTFKVWKKFR